jgi:hypothetical protein
MEITQYEIDERQVVKLEIIDKIDEMIGYEGMDVMPASWALKMVQLYIKHMDDTDDEV